MSDYFRESHVYRVFQNNDSTSDVWIDVERIDKLKRSTEQGTDSQLSNWEFDWDSINDSDLPTKTIKDPNDDNNTIDLPVRESIRVVSDIDGQGYVFSFFNNDSNNTRETHSRRVYHHDIKDDYLDSDGNPPSDPQDYLNSLGTQDQSDYLDVEIIDSIWTGEKRVRDIHGRPVRNIKALMKAVQEYAQKKKWLSSADDRLLRDPMLDDDTADPSFTVTYNGGDQGGGQTTIDPPWRIDPFQNIVNVSWGAGLAVEFGDGASDAPSMPPPSSG